VFQFPRFGANTVTVTEIVRNYYKGKKKKKNWLELVSGRDELR
jgi:hypothetical protein